MGETVDGTRYVAGKTEICFAICCLEVEMSN